MSAGSPWDKSGAIAARLSVGLQKIYADEPRRYTCAYETGFHWGVVSFYCSCAAEAKIRPCLKAVRRRKVHTRVCAVRGEFPPLGIDRARFPFIDWNSARGQQPKKNPCHYLQKESLPFCNAGGNLQLDPAFRGRPNTRVHFLVQLSSFNFPRWSTRVGRRPDHREGGPLQHKTYEETANQ